MCQESILLSVVIVSYNTRELTLKCLDTLYQRCDGLDPEVRVVDNGSQDGSAEAIRERFPQVTLIESDRNLGFGGANNLGMEGARGRFFLLLNSDAFPQPGALKALCDFLEAHPDVGAVGPRLENLDGTLQKSCYRFPSPVRVLAENLLLVAAFPNNAIWGDYRAFDHDTLRYVDFVSGAAFVVRREVFEKTGGFDDGFFVYAEETDWQLRMHKAGWKVAFVPNMTVVHYGGQSSTAIKDRQFCEFHRSQLRFLRKHYGPVAALFARGAMCLGAVVRMTIWNLLSVIKPSRRAELKPQIQLWVRILKWYLWMGPHEGIRELAQQSGSAQQAALPPVA